MNYLGDNLVVTSINEHYTDGIYNNCVEAKCSEKSCRLKDVSRRDHLILNGDTIESCKNSCQPNPSCDCIILKKRYDGKVLLIELKKGKTSINDAKVKFQNSGNEIMETFELKGHPQPSLSLVLIGKLDDSGRKSRNREFIINGKYCFIDVKNCGFSIKDLTNF